VRRGATAILLAGLLLLVACGGGGQTTTGGPPITVTLSADALSVGHGGSVTVTAVVYDQNNQGVTWTFTPSSFGTLSKQTGTTVTYTAPASIPRPIPVIVTAASVTNPNVVASTRVMVLPIIVSLFPLSDQTVNQGDELPVIATPNNDSSGKGVRWSLRPAAGRGSLKDVKPGSVTYVAPATVTTPTTTTLVATSVADSSVFARIGITVFPSGAGFNTAVVRVNGGPVFRRIAPNAAFTSVTICNPGSTTICQAIDGILVDTGSSGLRILESAIPLLTLNKLSDGSGNTLENCSTQPDGSFRWGPVEGADVYIAGEIAAASPTRGELLQVISNEGDTVPTTCSNSSTTNQNTPELLGANGILGIGPEPTDCAIGGTNLCDGSIQPVPPNLYYACGRKGCSATDTAIIVPPNQQVSNPIALFASDANGVVLEFPSAASTQATLTGTMTFGIETLPNNLLGSATVLPTNSEGFFLSTFRGQRLTRSVITSGANAFLFPDSLPACAVHSEFFCPAGPSALSAINEGANSAENKVNFSIDNADKLLAAHLGNAVFSTLSGPTGKPNSCSETNLSSCVFEWGLPFFYGRRVFTHIDGQSAPPGTPLTGWWAY